MYRISTPEPTLYSASALASVGAASVSLVSAGAAVVSAAAGSASEEVQRVWKKSVSPIREIKQREHGSTAYQVISQELHDQCRVLVAFLAQGVEFCRTNRLAGGSRFERKRIYQQWHHQRLAWQDGKLDRVSSRSHSRKRRS